MGLSGPDPTSFSDDVLRLEICGPSEEHLSVIDVPGIFKKTTQGVTTKADMLMVKSMVHGYMKNPRSVMLAVVPANVDIATQEILEMAEDVDADGHRTLGVLTKPDLVDKGAENAVIELIEGRRHQLTLGWYVVKNPGQSQLPNSAKERLALEEAFFKGEMPWNRLDRDRLGVTSLRIRLQEILAKHIRREFPKVRVPSATVLLDASSLTFHLQVKVEINKRLMACKESLKSLGADRDTQAEQTKYLLAVATEFQRITSHALDAKYGGDNVFDQHPSLRLATMVVDRNESFAEAVAANGHMFCFSTSQPPDAPFAEIVSQGDMPAGKIVAVRMTENDPDLEGILYDQVCLDEPERNGILDWLKDLHKTSRGFGLGMSDPSLLAITMRKLSFNWTGLALGYISDIVTMTHAFICDLLRIVCPDERVRAGLLSRLAENLLAKYKEAYSFAEFLLEVERSGTPTTLNHYFNDNLEKWYVDNLNTAS
jgi:Dynamin family/Dynamin central region